MGWKAFFVCVFWIAVTFSAHAKGESYGLGSNWYSLRPNKTDSILKSKKGIAKVLYICHPIINLDARRSYFLKNWVKMNGFRLGFEMYDRYRFGLGVYESNRIALPSIKRGEQITDVNMEFQYSTLFFEYVAYQNYKWEAVIPFGMGGGHATVFLRDRETDFDTTAVIDKIPIITLGGAAEYKIWPFLGVGAGLGLRLITINKNQVESKNDIRRAFNAPFYAIRLKLHLGALGKYFFNRKKYDEEKQEYLDSKNGKTGIQRYL